MLINMGNIPAVPQPSAVREPKEMLTILKDEKGRDVVRINYSSLSIILSCPRKSYYSLHRALKARQESSATLFGSAIHKALETYYLAPRSERVMPRNFNELSDLMPFQEESLWQTDSLLFRCVGDFIKKAEPLRLMPDTDARSISSGVYLLQNYFKVWLDDPWVVFRDADGPVVERRGELKIYEDEKLVIIIHGTVDVVLRNEQTGVVLATDHKTSSRVGNEFYNRLKPNHQYTAYYLIAREVFGITAAGFMVNCLQTKARPLTARGGPPQFPRQVTTRNETDIQEFKDSVIEATRNFLRWRSEDKWPLGPISACTEWGACEYREVCACEPEIRETMIENKFQTTKVPQ